MKTKNFSHHSRAATMAAMSLLLLFAAATAVQPARIVLVFAPDSGLTPVVVAAATREASAIWSGGGVAVERALAHADAGDAMVILVSNAAPKTRVRRDDALGEVRFRDGKAAGLITIYFDALMRLVQHATLAGATESQWPALLRERIVGRALGRVLAHEIGHIVLQSGRHTPNGLMRASYPGADLIEPGRRQFVIDVPEPF
jgi:hypothetical protein